MLEMEGIIHTVAWPRLSTTARKAQRKGGEQRAVNDALRLFPVRTVSE